MNATSRWRQERGYNRNHFGPGEGMTSQDLSYRPPDKFPITRLIRRLDATLLLLLR
jgi:hypothetical protein